MCSLDSFASVCSVSLRSSLCGLFRVVRLVFAQLESANDKPSTHNHAALPHPPPARRPRPAKSRHPLPARESARLSSVFAPLKLRQSSGQGAGLAPLVNFYSKLPKGPAPASAAGGIKGRFFNGKNASGAPLVWLIAGIFGLGYTIDYQSTFSPCPFANAVAHASFSLQCT